MNSAEKKNSKSLNEHKNNKKDSSNDGPLSEHYVVKGFEGEYKKDPNESESRWC